MDNQLRSKVLGIQELFEMILHQLPARDVLLAMRVDKHWNDVINDSPSLRCKLFFEPLKNTKADEVASGEDNKDKDANNKATKEEVEANPINTFLFKPKPVTPKGRVRRAFSGELTDCVEYHLAIPLDKLLSHDASITPTWKKMVLGDPAVNEAFIHWSQFDDFTGMRPAHCSDAMWASLQTTGKGQTWVINTTKKGVTMDQLINAHYRLEADTCDKQRGILLVPVVEKMRGGTELETAMEKCRKSNPFRKGWGGEPKDAMLIRYPFDPSTPWAEVVEVPNVPRAIPGSDDTARGRCQGGLRWRGERMLTRTKP